MGGSRNAILVQPGRDVGHTAVYSASNSSEGISTCRKNAPLYVISCQMPCQIQPASWKEILDELEAARAFESVIKDTTCIQDFVKFVSVPQSGHPPVLIPMIRWKV